MSACYIPQCNADGAEIDFIEGRGALNFLDFDDLPIVEECESLGHIIGADLLGRPLRGI